MQSKLPILGALVVAVVAALMTNMHVNQIRAESRPQTVPAVVAAKPLVAGSLLEQADVQLARMFQASVPKFYIPWAEANLYFGSELNFDVQQGDYVLASYFGATTGGGRSLSQKIDAKTSQRAMTIPVDNEMALEGSLRPGDRVDLLITYKHSVSGGVEGGQRGGGLETVTAPLLENVYILATGKFGGGENIRFRSITVLLSPDEAKLLTWAMSVGELAVLLRNPKDLTLTDRAAIAGGADVLSGLSDVKLRVSEVVHSAVRESGDL